MTHKFVESKTFDQSRTKDIGNSSSNVGKHGNTEPDVRLGVDKDLLGLVPLPLSGSGTGLVCPQSLDGLLLLVFGEESSRLNVVIQEHPDETGTEYGDDTGDQVKRLPRLE